MATQALQSGTPTVTSTFHGTGEAGRVEFVSFDSGQIGFSLSELDALEAAIHYVRKRMSTPELTVLCPPEDDDIELMQRHSEQLRQMNPVTT